MDVGTRRIRHWNVTDHPTTDWTAEQFRMVMSGDESYRFLIHDYDSVYSEDVDGTITAMGLTILKTPVRAPQANAFCEGLIGTMWRECLDWMIPFSEDHLRAILRSGWHITTGAVRMRALGRAFPTGLLSRRCCRIFRFLTVTASSRNPFRGPSRCRAAPR